MPENSEALFMQCFDTGFPSIEIDVFQRYATESLFEVQNEPRYSRMFQVS